MQLKRNTRLENHDERAQSNNYSKECNEDISIVIKIKIIYQKPKVP